MLELEKLDGISYPSREDVPREYFRDSNPCNKLASKWFFEGVPGYVFEAREGVPRKGALLVIRECLTNFNLEHGHKIALAAYMLESFFSSIKDPAGVECMMSS